MNILAKGNSMFPTLKDGQTYCIEILKDDDISVGDIIVYCVDDLTICHRVIKVLRLKNGFLFFKTKGDNCIEPDPYAVSLDMIIGKISL